MEELKIDLDILNERYAEVSAKYEERLAVLPKLDEQYYEICNLISQKQAEASSLVADAQAKAMEIQQNAQNKMEETKQAIISEASAIKQDAIAKLAEATEMMQTAKNELQRVEQEKQNVVLLLQEVQNTRSLLEQEKNKTHEEYQASLISRSDANLALKTAENMKKEVDDKLHILEKEKSVFIENCNTYDREYINKMDICREKEKQLDQLITENTRLVEDNTSKNNRIAVLLEETRQAQEKQMEITRQVEMLKSGLDAEEKTFIENNINYGKGKKQGGIGG